MATVAEVMTRNVLSVDPTASIGEAAEKMMDAGVGAVVVMEDMVRLVGIVTERDILGAVAQRARAAEARVRQWMTESVITIDPETTVEEAAQMMFEKNFRHLPVCKDGRAADHALRLVHQQRLHCRGSEVEAEEQVFAPAVRRPAGAGPGGEKLGRSGRTDDRQLHRLRG